MSEITHRTPWLTMPQAQAALGGCSRTYIYRLIARGRLESINALGRKRLISAASIERLAHPEQLELPFGGPGAAARGTD